MFVSDVIIEVIIGCLSSLILWWIINFICSPQLKVEKKIEVNTANDRFVEIKNKSLFNAYNVLIRVEYRNNNNPNDAHVGTKPGIPTIEKGEIFQIELADLDGFSINEFFCKSKEQDSLVIVASYESKFGVRKVAKKTIFVKRVNQNTRRVRIN